MTGQLARARRYIERLITSPSLGADGRLPSTRTLAATLGCARTTVNAAVDELVAEGYLIARPRSGLFANPHLRQITDGAGPSDDALEWESKLATPPIVRTAPSLAWTKAPYPLLTGQIAPSLLVRRGWTRALRAASEQAVWSYVEHGDNDPLLAEQICATIAPSRGIQAEPENILITVGSQHALVLVATALVRELQSTVAIEDPGYPGAREVFASRGARLIPVPVDHEGLRVDHMSADTDIVYVTPSHQHPTNVTLSIERRAELIRAARRFDFAIIEDDYDSELRFAGPPSPALYSLDRGSRTIYLGTFSKLHSPGLRLGYVIADSRVIESLRPWLHLGVRQVPGLLQRALALYIQSGDYSRSLARYKQELRTRWKLTAELLHERLGVDDEVPPGGTSIWTRAPDGVDWADVVAPAQRRGVVLNNPAQHWLRPRPRYDRLRIGFTAAVSDRLAPAIEQLAMACDEVRRAD